MNTLILPCWSVQSSFWWPCGKAVYIGWFQLECMNSCYIWTNKTGIWLSLQVLVTLQESLPLVTALPAKVKCFSIAISISFCFVFLICVFIPGTTQMPTHVAQVCVLDSEPIAALGVLNTWEAWGQVADVWAGGLATPSGPGVDIHALP